MVEEDGVMDAEMGTEDHNNEMRSRKRLLKVSGGREGIIEGVMVVVSGCLSSSHSD